jgi:hypothetical protein
LFSFSRSVLSGGIGTGLQKIWFADSICVSSLSYAELYLGLAAVLRRFELELYDTVRERDVDTVRDCFVGMPTPEAKGVRVRVLGKRP